ncbi:MAG TPA: galactose-1-phosphate uridylyltransferase [Planctomycetaceae bacterium]|nr:galactose-1-phosphate uridylyltransferase [Planctomycetaceae bacterium]
MTEDVSTPSAEHHEVRYDPIHGWPVIFAPPRAKRPNSILSPTAQSIPDSNPFAEHNEYLTTRESYADRQPDTQPNAPGWHVRIIPNKYPVLSASAGELIDEELRTRNEATGCHEVIVESPHPVANVCDLSEDQFLRIFLSYRARLKVIADEQRYAHVTIFKNQGRAAGASQPHVHSQLMATSFVPPMVSTEVEYSRRYQLHMGCSYLEELIKQEIQLGTRIVLQTDAFSVFCPYASRFAFEVHLLPLQPQPHFHLATDHEVRETAHLMKQTLVRLQKSIGATEFNYILHTAPFADDSSSGFCWHWEIYPRLSGIAGWELGQGSYVNPIYPEFAAETLVSV